MKPPWVELPSIPCGSIGWRMGIGERYWVKFDQWWKSLSAEKREKYTRENPEPQGWEGFYQRKTGRYKTTR